MRDIDLLHPQLRLKVAEFLKCCEEQGYKVGISQTLRTVQEQNDLYAQGRTKPGRIVTNANGSTYSSFHMWGLAFDIYRDDGKNIYDNSDGFFNKVGAIGQSLGLDWGGSWKSFKDLPHFQLDDFGSTSSELKRKYGTPDNFFKTWSSIEELIADAIEQELNNKYGEKITEESFITKSNVYLRTSPATGPNKVKYSELSDTLKKKCIEDEKGCAIFKKGKKFTRIRSFIDENENKWMQTKSGYWLSAIYNGKRKVSKS